MTPRGVPSTSPTARLFTAGGVKRRCEMTPRGVRALHLRRGGARLGGRAVRGRRRAAPVRAHLLKVVRPGRVEGRPPVLPAPAARRDAQGARSREIARDRPRLHDAMLKAVGRAAHAHARGARAGAGAAMGGGCVGRCRTPSLPISPPVSPYLGGRVGRCRTRCRRTRAAPRSDSPSRRWEGLGEAGGVELTRDSREIGRESRRWKGSARRGCASRRVGR